MATKKEKRYARLWAVAQLKTYTTSEIVERLYRFRTFYVSAWEDCLERGEVGEVGQFSSKIDQINHLLLDIETEKTNAATAIAQTVLRHPLMLAPMEDIEFGELLEGDNVVAH